jgi:hypothetical protein
MEPVRPLVDAYVFDWLNRGPLQRSWFFEEANGNCRLMGKFASELSQTALIWRKAVSPYAEEAAKIFWQGRTRRSPFNPEKTYGSKILPHLSKFTVKAISLALDVSHPYATNIRRGTTIPHPRHWMTLAKLAGVMVNSRLENSPVSVVDSSRASQRTKARVQGR